MPWCVLACEGGYIANLFHYFNSSPVDPRLAVVEDLQEASIFFGDDETRYWQRLGMNVLGVESRPVSIRFRQVSKPGAKKKETILELIKKGG